MKKLPQVVRFIILLFTISSIPMAVLAQDNELYLDKDYYPTKVKSDITCRVNEELSRGKSYCYDCYDANNHLVAQLNGIFYLSAAIVGEKNFPYIKEPKEPHKVYLDEEDDAYLEKAKIRSIAGSYLIGFYQDGKPLNGFFRDEDSAYSEWYLCNFYEGGAHTEQFYNDMFGSFGEEKPDSPITWYALDAKSTFGKDGEVENGTRLSVQKEKGSLVVAERISNKQTVDFTIGIFAIHYGAFLRISPRADGYLFENVVPSSIVKIGLTYTSNGRILSELGIPAKRAEEAEFIYYDVLSPAVVLKDGGMLRYFKKDGRIYAEMLRSASKGWKESKFEDYKNNGEEGLLRMMAESFYLVPHVLTSNDILDFVTHKMWPGSGNLGYLVSDPVDSGFITYGLRFEAGSTPNTYTIKLCSESEPELLAENVTADEAERIITKLMARGGSRDDEEEENDK